MRTALAAVLYTVLVPGLLTIGIPWAIVGDAALRIPDLPGWNQAIGGLLILLPAALIVWCVHDFVRRGAGTPAPLAPPRDLVTAGAYRWTRNPLYLGVIGMILGEALWFRSTTLLLHAAGTWMTMEVFLQWHEEPALERRFGARYRAYRSRVPRWFGRPRAAADPPPG